MRIITGFHAIEEELRAIEKKETGKPAEKIAGLKIIYAKPGPRVKKILATATALGIPSSETDMDAIDRMVSSLPVTARDHRGIVLVMENAEQAAPLRMDECVKELALKEKALVLILDSITDPQNVGAIIRSADQFGVDLVVLPEHRGATDFEVISRTSAGAASWVNIVRGSGSTAPTPAAHRPRSSTSRERPPSCSAAKEPAWPASSRQSATPSFPSRPGENSTV